MKSRNNYRFIACILFLFIISIGLNKTINAQEKPKAPKLQKTEAVSYSQIDITWEDCSDSEDRFVIFRSTNGKLFVKVAEVDKDVTVFSDKNLKKSTRYFYQVFACNKDGFNVSERKDDYTLDNIIAQVDSISSLKVLPNPVSNLATIVIDVPVKMEASLQICDLNNNTRINAFQNKRLDAGENTFSVNTTSLERGFYIVRAITATHLTSLKLQVVK